MSASMCRCAFGELEYKRLLVLALVLAKIRAYTCGRVHWLEEVIYALGV